MFELTFVFLLEDGTPSKHYEQAQVMTLCTMDDDAVRARISKWDGVTIEDEDYYCPKVFFEKKWQCEMYGPWLFGDLIFEGFHNGAELPPFYGLKWQCQRSAQWF